MNKTFIYAVFTLFFLIGDRLVMAVSVEEDLSMTLGEKQILDKFRVQVEPLLYRDFMKTDIYLVRWLRARNFNLYEAEKMLRENHRWRKEQRIDTIESEDFTDIADELPFTVDTHDLAGRPVAVLDYFAWDLRSVILTGQRGRALRWLDKQMNNLTLQVFEQQRKGLNVTQWTVLGNMEGFNMINNGCPLCLSVWVPFMSSLEHYFPGWAHELFLIEVSTAVHTLFELVKPMLSKNTRDIMHLYGPKSQWLPYLDERMSRSERRAPYGGTRLAIGSH